MKTSTQPNRKVLLVDDDEIVSKSIIHFGNVFGFALDFRCAGDVGEAIERLNEVCFDAAVIDVQLPGVSGVSLGDLVREHDVNIPLAYLTNMDTENVRIEAMSQHAFYLAKSRFFGTDEGMKNLLAVISEMSQLNPCIEGGMRIDNHGYPRRLKHTPLELPKGLAVLLNHGKRTAAAA